MRNITCTSNFYQKWIFCLEWIVFSITCLPSPEEGERDLIIVTGLVFALGQEKKTKHTFNWNQEKIKQQFRSPQCWNIVQGWLSEASVPRSISHDLEGLKIYSNSLLINISMSKQMYSECLLMLNIKLEIHGCQWLPNAQFPSCFHLNANDSWWEMALMMMHPI